MEVTAKGLGSQMGAVLACLDRGETVTVTYRGKPRAKLVSIEQEGRAKLEEKGTPTLSPHPKKGHPPRAGSTGRD